MTSGEIPLVCPSCRGPVSETNRAEEPSREPVVVCRDCGAVYPFYGGVPVMGLFSDAEWLTLYEIGSVFHNCEVNHAGVQSVGISADSHQRLLKRLLALQTAVPNRENWRDYVAAHCPPGLQKRYQDFQFALQTLDGEDLSGKTVLDCGAGSGFDATVWRYFGATVYACEINPLQAAAGPATGAAHSWVCANARRLPYADNSFDIVTAGNALHHMVELEASIHEMMRVLKPGGVFISTSDMFGPDGHGQREEIAEFSRHPSVLMGVNEQRPAFGRYYDPFLSWATADDTEVSSNIVHGLHPWSDTLVRHPPTMRDSLRKYRGGVFLKARKTRSYAPVDNEPSSVVEGHAFVDALASRRDYLRFIARHAPARYRNADMIALAGKDKLALLMGWSPNSETTGLAEDAASASILGAAYAIVDQDYDLPPLRVWSTDDEPVRVTIALDAREAAWWFLEPNAVKEFDIRSMIKTAGLAGPSSLRVGHEFEAPGDRRWLESSWNSLGRV